MKDIKVKTRFAPSPTGYLHIGGARTALFNYAYAKHFGGKFVLRIEDTDFERSTKEFEADILDSLKWLSIVSDEDAVYQSQRQGIYKGYADRLLKDGKAYYCFCSKELLEEDRSRLMTEGKKPMYVGRCLNLKPDEIDLSKPHVIRFKVERGQGLATGFKDLIRNQFVSFNNNEIDDFVLVREDGIPTYNFAVVIDDALMEITHIIRGDDHVSNTPKQIMLYGALGFKMPEFAHVSMILGQDGKRLSKRHGATSVNQYKKEGFLPEALVNYLIRLGWSHGNDEIFTMDEIIRYFDLKNISKSAAIFNTEKLLWLNSHYIKSKDPFNIINLLNDIRDVSEKPIAADIQTVSLVDSLKSRVKTLVEFRQKLNFFISEEPGYKTELLTEFNFNEGDLFFLKEFKAFIAGLPDIIFNYKEGGLNDKAGTLNFIKNSIESVKQEFNNFLSKNNWTMKEKAMIIRLALTGEKVSPPIFEIIFALGKIRCIKRINEFCEFINPAKPARA
ncbi:MAG: glutamate--tRNA ligase [Deltaproteobacteria bacterium]|nr:glutamate--tRNA ligase [Deltaproteobacteria bacterium]